MSKPPPPAEDVARAREMYERGDSLRDIGRALGKSRESIRRWATNPDDPWERPLIAKGADGERKPVPSTEEIEAARMRAEKARQESRTRWATRRAEEADAAGVTASVVRGKILAAVQRDTPDADGARKLATVYGILVDKAMLMSGEGIVRGRQGDEPAIERPTDPAAMVAAGAARALRLVPAVNVASAEK